MRRTIVLIAAGLALLATAAATEPAPRIELQGRDQHDREIESRSYADRPLLLLWGDRRGSEFMLAWNRALGAAGVDPALARLDVAHGRGAPFFVKGRIRNRFRRDWDLPVLMDWKGRVQEAYGCAADSCTVLLFDRDGLLRGRWTVGAVSDSTLALIERETAPLLSPER